MWLIRYWHDTPPAHVTLAALLHALGGKRSAGGARPPHVGTDEEAAAFSALMKDGAQRMASKDFMR